MTKFKAFLLHFSLSLSIFCAVTLLVALIWYPSIYLETSGVWKAMQMVALVDVGLGPLMTLILFKKNKPGLKFDLSVVAIVQVIALCYGVSVLYSQKPVLTVFHDGFFVCLNQQQVDYAVVDLSLLNSPNHPVVVAVLPPLTLEQLQDWQQRSLQLPPGYPKHPGFVYGDAMVAYPGESLATVLEDEWDLSRQIVMDEADGKVWQSYEREYGTDANHAFFPLTCGFHQYMVAVNALSGQFDEVLDISFINTQRKRLMPR
ncbi:MAG: hypothetical protein V7739_08405 [Motiliproteus sp.]